MEHRQRWGRAGAVTLRSTLLVATWVANLRYGPTRRITGSDNPTLRLADFDRIARVLQDRYSVVRAHLVHDVGEANVLRSELEHDIEAGLIALGHIIEHEDQPFARAQMRQMIDSLAGLERLYVRSRQLAA